MRVRLSELDPHWIRYEWRDDTWQQIVGPHETWEERGRPSVKVTGRREHTLLQGVTFETAQGVLFNCPCGSGHIVMASFAGRGLTDDQGTHNKAGQPVRWTTSGSTFDDLTLQPSILLEGGCNWHGFITNGDVTTC